jgi:hypothetical protein
MANRHPSGTRHKGLAKSGGRTKGVRNRKTERGKTAAERTGVTPLDFLLKVMRNVKEPMWLRIDCAKAAAPYVHPRLSAITTDTKGTVIVIKGGLPDDDGDESS